MKDKLKILVLCTGNSCRSQMAEGFFRHYGGDKIEVKSAGLEPKGVNPLAVKVMKEVGIDISSHRSKHLNEFLNEDFDYIITVCDNAAKNCPVWPIRPNPSASLGTSPLAPKRPNPPAPFPERKGEEDCGRQTPSSAPKSHLEPVEGRPVRLHWPFTDPVFATGTEEEILQVFRKVRDGIGERVEKSFELMLNKNF